MTIITLTTDWGHANHYAGAVKGLLMKLIPDAMVIDISHGVALFDIMQASFVLRNAYPHFPDGSIHLLGVNSEADVNAPHIAIRHQGHYFIGADNGVFSLVFDNEPEQAVELEILQDSDYFTFSTRDVFAKAAAHIARGDGLEALGRPHKELNQRIPFRPVIYPGRIIGKVIFVDGYGNVVVNIDRHIFRQVGKNLPFFISFRSQGDGIAKIHKAYADVVPGEKLALFGSTGFLEIAINQGKASDLLGLQLNDTVSVEFETEG